MKKLIYYLMIITLIIYNTGPIVFVTSVLADGPTIYYVSNEGDDNNDGLSTATPWKTLEKVNASRFSPGDSILFKAGDSFEGGIVISDSGTNPDPITYSSYGAGVKPVISGFTRVQGWVDLGNNIWESTNEVSQLDNVALVSVDDTNTPMGRYPNDGYLTYESHDGMNSITSSALDSTTINWEGAEVVYRTVTRIIDKGPITDHTNQTLTFSPKGGVYEPVDNWGFFIQNDPRTLDMQNERYYNPTTHKLQIYSTGEPSSNVNVTSTDTLIDQNGKNNIVIDGIHLEGANQYAIKGNTGPLNIIDNDISFVGDTAIHFLGYPSGSGVIIENNTIDHINNNGIYVDYGSSSAPLSIENNNISNISLIPGASGPKDRAGLGILTSTINSVANIQGNRVDNVGYVGISFNPAFVKNNYVSNVCLVKQDCGGLYIYGGTSNTTITDNVVANIYGDYRGTYNQYTSHHMDEKHSNGIYLDNNSSGVTVTNNIIAHVEGKGITMSDPDSTLVRNNTIYDVNNGLYIKIYSKAVHDMAIDNNIVAIQDPSIDRGFAADMRSTSDPSTWGVIDNNNYISLDGTNPSFHIEYFVPSYSKPIYNFDQRKTTTQQDTHSSTSAIDAGDSDDEVVFDYASTTSKTVSLSGTYKDASGTFYTGDITLEPRSALLLLKTDEVPGSPNLSGALVNFYQDSNFEGTSGSLGIGNYTRQQMASAGVSNNRVSSVKIPVGLKVVLYDGDNFTGDFITLYRDTISLNEFNFNDKMSSVSISIDENPKEFPLTYYVSSSQGDDSNDGLSSSRPWKTLDRINSGTVFYPGDSILFKAGDEFYGSLQINYSGIPGESIRYSSYGSGAKPIISGLKAVTQWTNVGNNIWESTQPVSDLDEVRMVVRDSVTIPMGTYPNRDSSYPFLPNFLTFQSHTGSGKGQTSLTSAELSGNRIGADIVVRANRRTLDREIITDQVDKTITYDGGTDGTDGGGLIDGWGFYIQNSPQTLDQQNERYYDPTTHKLQIYSNGKPSSVGVSSVPYVVDASTSTKNNIIIDNLDIRGGNDGGINFKKTENLQIINSNLTYIGGHGIYAQNLSYNVFIDNNTMSDISDSAVYYVAGIDNGPSGWIVSNNNVERVTLMTIGRRSDGPVTTISVHADDALLQYNHVNMAGQGGIRIRGARSKAINNFVQNIALLRDDSGGIVSGHPYEEGKVISGNIVLNVIGNGRGVAGGGRAANGIYCDGRCDTATINNNIVAHIASAGIFFNNNRATNAHGNIVFDVGGGSWTKGSAMVQTYGDMPYFGGPSFAGYQRNMNITGNIFFQLYPAQTNFFYYTANDSDNNIADFGVLDKNIYGKASDNKLFTYKPDGGTASIYTLAEFQAATNKELNATSYKKNGSLEPSDVLLVYNPSKTTTVKYFSGVYEDVYDVVYSGSISLEPYGGALLIRQDASTEQVATFYNNSNYAGASQSLSVGNYDNERLLANDIANNSISSLRLDSGYQLTVYDGNNFNGDSQVITGDISNLSSVNFNDKISSLRIEALAQSGGSSEAPQVNVTPSQTIYLKQGSSAILSGTAVGDNLSYERSEVSTDYGSQATITSPHSLTTTVSGLPQGVFYFMLTARDPYGQVATGVTTINVDYDVPPSGSTLLRSLQLPQIGAVVNTRQAGDLLNFSMPAVPGQAGSNLGNNGFQTSAPDGFRVDSYNGKLIATVKDNTKRNGANYARTEMYYPGSTFPLPTNTTYVYERKGYFPQQPSISFDRADVGAITIMQVHGNDDLSPPYSFTITKDNLIFSESDMFGDTVSTKTILGASDDFYNTTHTIRLTVREGEKDSGAFLIVQLDGVEVYSRYSKLIGRTPGRDYMKFGGIYDSGRTLVDPSQTQRNKTFSLVTEAFNVYEIPDTAPMPYPPTAEAGKNQQLFLPTTTTLLQGIGSVSSGNIISYQWTKVSGKGTISSPNSAQTEVTGLTSAGDSIFRLTVTDSNGGTDYDDVRVRMYDRPPYAILYNECGFAGDQVLIMEDRGYVLSSLVAAGMQDNTISSIQVLSGYQVLLYDDAAYGGVPVAVHNDVMCLDSIGMDNKISSLKVEQYNDGSGGGGPVYTDPSLTVGGGQSIQLPTTTGSLSATSSGDIIAYQWTQTSGPKNATIVSPNSLNTNVVDLTTAGVYEFMITASGHNNTIATGSTFILVSKLATSGVATFYEDSNYGGYHFGINPGSYTTIQLRDIGIRNNNISSLKVASGYQVTMYDLDNFTGDFRVFTSDVSNLVSHSFNDMMSSVIIQALSGTNTPPVAHAGPDQTIQLPVNSVTISGSGSDSDGSIVSYAWTKISGQGTIVSPSAASTQVTGLTATGSSVFRLTVTDNQGATGYDDVVITVNAANVAPVANAGGNKTITLPTTQVTLSGSGYDSDGSVVSYLWTKLSGQGTISSASSASTQVTGLTATGSSVFRLTVTDNQGATGYDDVVIMVNAANVAPHVDAGSDQTIQLPTTSVSLHGSGYDLDGNIVSSSRTKIRGSGGQIVTPNNFNTLVQGLSEGSYVFRLTVIDNEGASSTADTTIIVKPANIAPVAHAGSDQTIQLPITSTLLSGSGSDSDGTVISYAWTNLSGGSANIVSPSSASTVISNLSVGSYTFRLTVTDNQGATGYDDVVITVKDNDPPNTGPVVTPPYGAIGGGYSLIPFPGLINGSNSESHGSNATSSQKTGNQSTISGNSSIQEKIYAVLGAETQQVYKFSYGHGLTTMQTLEDAHFDRPTTRAELAKIIANYALNVLGQKPATTRSCVFDDTDMVDESLKPWIITSCQLGLMGQNTQDHFYPERLVTRGESATIISRIYGWAQDTEPYYANHIQAIAEKGYITNTNPQMIESRSYVG